LDPEDCGAQMSNEIESDASRKISRRREFLAGVASAVVLRPLSAGAEQT